MPAPALTADILEQVRAMSAGSRAALSQSSDLSVTECFVPGPEGAPDVRVLVSLPSSVQGPLPATLWLHGGGYIMGSADAEDVIVRSIVAAVGCAAVVVDYRLAPETPYPGPLEDCYAAL